MAKDLFSDCGQETKVTPNLIATIIVGKILSKKTKFFTTCSNLLLTENKLVFRVVSKIPGTAVHITDLAASK